MFFRYILIVLLHKYKILRNKHILQESAYIKIERIIGGIILISSLRNRFTELMIKYRDLQKQLQIEPLTGFLNNEAFFYELNHFLKNVQDERISLAIVDLDNFTTINAYFGHLIGDEVILNLVRIIKIYEDKDIVYGRYGEKEFALLFKNHSIIKVVAICEGIREHFARNTLESTNHMPNTISIGIVNYTSHIKDSNQFIRLGEKALYKAKKAGKNKIVIC